MSRVTIKNPAVLKLRDSSGNALNGINYFILKACLYSELVAEQAAMAALDKQDFVIVNSAGLKARVDIVAVLRDPGQLEGAAPGFGTVDLHIVAGGVAEEMQ